MEIHASKLGSICGVNPFENRDLCILEYKVKKEKCKYRRELLDLGIISVLKLDSENISKKLKVVYKNHQSEIKNPSDFSKRKREIIEELGKTVELDDKNLSLVEDIVNNNMKKDCGKNNESTVISNNNYKKGNSKLWIWSHPELNYTIKGFHDASKGDIVIEIKTRMKQANIRKNKYDLYQLFGYLLLMNKTKGKIVQYFNNLTYDSDVETNNEYGIVDITLEPWSTMFNTFLKEVNCFVEDVDSVEINLQDLFKNIDKPIANVDIDGIYCNINPKYENLIKCLY